jgi:hypothetical protein
MTFRRRCVCVDRETPKTAYAALHKSNLRELFLASDVRSLDFEDVEAPETTKAAPRGAAFVGGARTGNRRRRPAPGSGDQSSSVAA